MLTTLEPTNVIHAQTDTTFAYYPLNLSKNLFSSTGAGDLQLIWPIHDWRMLNKLKFTHGQTFPRVHDTSWFHFCIHVILHYYLSYFLTLLITLSIRYYVIILSSTLVKVDSTIFTK